LSLCAPADARSDKAHTLLAGFYHAYPQYSATPANASASASAHATRASELQTAILDVFWSPSKLAFYDFILDNSTSALAASPGSSRTGTPSSLWSAATFYPFWVGIVPSQVASNASAAFGAFSALNLVLSRYNGTIPVTFLETGQQWDAPNAWPPHQYIALQALRNLPANVTGAALPTPPAGQGSFALVPAGQLNVAEGALPAQQLSVSANASASGAAADVNALNGTVANGGNATQGEGWADRLQRELANRYIASALCSWHATGGSVPNLLPRLSDAELNVTQSQNLTGIVRPPARPAHTG
jgi:alpha,alpha-trehalase